MVSTELNTKIEILIILTSGNHRSINAFALNICTHYMHAFGYPLRNSIPIASERAESKCMNARIVRLFMNKDAKKNYGQVKPEKSWLVVFENELKKDSIF